MSKHYPPTHKSTKFHCPHCGVFAAQYWETFRYIDKGSIVGKMDLTYCICVHCQEWSYWYKGRMIVPSEAPVPPPHHDMPEQCLGEYNEARDIVARSPRAASALLRLAIQKLLAALGEKGDNINVDIGELVKKSLPVQVQQALDYCRVVGNNAVHPGEIQINESPDIAHSLFDMMNFIVEDRISRPKHIEKLYGQLPEGARTAIEKRDKQPA